MLRLHSHLSCLVQLNQSQVLFFFYLLALSGRCEYSSCILGPAEELISVYFQMNSDMVSLRCDYDLNFNPKCLQKVLHLLRDQDPVVCVVNPWRLPLLSNHQLCLSSSSETSFIYRQKKIMFGCSVCVCGI